MNINEYRNRFYNLLESKLGNVKPLICEIEIGEDKIDLSQTYLSPEKMKELKDTNKTNTDPYFPSVKVKKVSDIKGNQFKDAGLISGNEYGITFEEITKNVYKVNFPNEFIQKYFSLDFRQESILWTDKTRVRIIEKEEKDLVRGCCCCCCGCCHGCCPSRCRGRCCCAVWRSQVDIVRTFPSVHLS